MDAFVIEGGRRLSGRIRVHGSKNSALPIMAASLLTTEPLRLAAFTETQGTVADLIEVVDVRWRPVLVGDRLRHHGFELREVMVTTEVGNPIGSAGPDVLGDPDDYASLALEIVRNGYLNGETIRMDAGIRMPPK